MAVIDNVNFNNFKENISKGKAIVYFYATWCGPCKLLRPIYEEVSEELKDVKFIDVDIDSEEELAQEYQIMAVPTLILFEDGSKIKTHSGFIDKNQLIKFLNE